MLGGFAVYCLEALVYGAWGFKQGNFKKKKQITILFGIDRDSYNLVETRLRFQAFK